MSGTWAGRLDPGGKPGGGATVVTGPEGKASRFLSCSKEESNEMLDSVRLMERTCRGDAVVWRLGLWLQMFDDHSELLLSSSLICSVLKLRLEGGGEEEGAKNEVDRFSRPCPGTLSWDGLGSKASSSAKFKRFCCRWSG